MADVELMGRNEYARHRGLKSPNAVHKAERDGRIAQAVKRDADGKFIGIDWRLADQLWAAMTDPAQAARSGTVVMPAVQTPGQPPAAPDAEQAAAGGEDAPAGDGEASAGTAKAGEGGKDFGYYAERAKRERFAAAQAELEYLEAIGAFVPVAELREAAHRRYRAMRDKWLNLPDREAPILAAELRVDAALLHAALSRVIRKALHELSDDAGAEVARGIAERVAA